MDEEMQINSDTFIVLAMIGFLTGASSGCIMSLTKLSPLVIGSITGSIPSLFYTSYIAGEAAYNFCKGNKNKTFYKESMIGLSTMAIGATIGGSLHVAVNSLLPDRVLEVSTILAGIATDTVVMPIDFLTAYFIQKKVSSRVSDIEVQEHIPLELWRVN